MKRVTSLHYGLLILGCALGVYAQGCELKDPCDPGQTYEYGLCLPPTAEGGAGGAPVCEELTIEGEPNVGDPCTEGGDECTGGTICGAPRLPECLALCGECDAFFENCPSGLTCRNLGPASLCQ
jgi:hypothetical protein